MSLMGQLRPIPLPQRPMRMAGVLRKQTPPSLTPDVGLRAAPGSLRLREESPVIPVSRRGTLSVILGGPSGPRFTLAIPTDT
jgi:hypothetical protein